MLFSAILSKEKEVPLHEMLVSTKLEIGWVGGAACLTGWLLLSTLVIMTVSAMPFVRRSGKFEVTFNTYTDLSYPVLNVKVK